MKSLVLFLIVFLFQLANAQEKKWTLDDCIQYAVEHNLLRAKQEAQNKIYKQDQREALGGFLPALSVSSSARMSFGRNIDPKTNGYTPHNTISNGIGIYPSLKLFDGLSQIYRAKMARINRLMGDDRLRDTKD